MSQAPPILFQFADGFDLASGRSALNRCDYGTAKVCVRPPLKTGEKLPDTRHGADPVIQLRRFQI